MGLTVSNIIYDQSNILPFYKNDELTIQMKSYNNIKKQHELNAYISDMDNLINNLANQLDTMMSQLKYIEDCINSNKEFDYYIGEILEHDLYFSYFGLHEQYQVLKKTHDTYVKYTDDSKNELVKLQQNLNNQYHFISWT